MTVATGKSLLDLDTLVEQPFITIHGERVDILDPDGLSVVESHRFGVWGKRIDQLIHETSEEASKELDDLVAIVARKICCGASDEQFAKLSGNQRWAIVDLFTGLLLREKLKVAGAMEAAMGLAPDKLGSLTGASSSPGSSVFTAAPRRTGFMARLSRWFGLS